MTKTIIEKVLGPSATVKVIDLLIGGRGFDWPVSDIAKGAKVSRPKVYEIIRNLMAYGILVETRVVSKTQLYKLNKQNEIVKGLLALDRSLLKYQEQQL